jgi:hypothetical protein
MECKGIYKTAINSPWLGLLSFPFRVFPSVLYAVVLASMYTSCPIHLILDLDIPISGKECKLWSS